MLLLNISHTSFFFLQICRCISSLYAFIALQHNIEITVYSILAVLQYLSVSWTDSIYMPVAVFADLDLDFHLNKTLPGSS